MDAKAQRNKDKLREALRTRRRVLREHSKVFPSLDANLYENWVGECVLRALAKTEYGDRWALKGGRMWTVWGGLSARPTRDTDIQVDAHVDPDVFKAVILETLRGQDFTDQYGLVVGDIRAEDIHAAPEGAFRLSGDVYLGTPGDRTTRIYLCMEVSFNEIPHFGVERRAVDPIVPGEKPYSIMCARPEWMLADKVRAALELGRDNTRLKDYRDAKLLLDWFQEPARGMELDVFRRCLEFTCQNRGVCVPPAVESAPGFVYGYGSTHGEQWRALRFPEYEGRAFDPERDPDLGELAEAIGMRLEDIGVFARRSATSRCSGLISSLMTEPRSAAEVREAIADVAAQLGQVDEQRFLARMRMVGPGKQEPSVWFRGLIDQLAGRGFLVGGYCDLAAVILKYFQDRAVCHDRAKPAIKATAKAGVTREGLEKAAVGIKSANPTSYLGAVATLYVAVCEGQEIGVDAVEAPSFPLDIAERAWKGVSRRYNIAVGFEDALDTVRSASRPHDVPGF